MQCCVHNYLDNDSFSSFSMEMWLQTFSFNSGLLTKVLYELFIDIFVCCTLCAPSLSDGFFSLLYLHKHHPMNKYNFSTFCLLLCDIKPALINGSSCAFGAQHTLHPYIYNSDSDKVKDKVGILWNVTKYRMQWFANITKLYFIHNKNIKYLN